MVDTDFGFSASTEPENGQQIDFKGIVKRGKIDFPFYCQKHLWINTKDSGIIKLDKFHYFQQRLWDRAKYCLDNGIPIRWIILKARQMGVSTWVEAFIYWRITTTHGQNAVIVAHKLDSSEHILGMEQLFFDYHDSVFRPAHRKSNRKELVFANPDPKPGESKGLNSRVRVATAGDEDLGASMTIHLAHLSELARWDRITDTQKALTSLNQTLSRGPGSAVIVESTALGDNYFKKMWEDPKNGYDKIFFSWLALPEYSIKITPDEYFDLSTITESTYGDEHIVADQIEKELKEWYPELAEDTPESRGKLLHEIMCRLAWRRNKIDTDCLGQQDLFKQEYPTTPEEAFIASGSSVFNGVRLADQEYRIVNAPIRRASFQFDAKCIDLLETQTQRKNWHKHAWVRGHGPLTVYYPPEEGKTYVFGLDPSDGINDPAVGVMLGLPEMEEVALLYTKQTGMDELAYMAAALGLLYNQAYLVCEANNPGKVTISELTKYIHYPRLYYRQTFDTATKEKTKRPGWLTTSTTKPFMIGALGELIDNNGVIINSMEVVKQLKQYRKIESDDLDSNKAKYSAPRGEHDDCVIALGLVVAGVQDLYLGGKPTEKPHPYSMQEVMKRDFKKMRMMRQFGENRYGRVSPYPAIGELL